MNSQIERLSLSQKEKYINFKLAFETLSTHRSNGNFMSAYVVAFSIFEDRVTAGLMLAKDLKGEERPTGYMTLYKKIGYLHRESHIDKATKLDWQKAGDERNELIHNAMWRIDVFTEKHVEGIYKHARKADSLASKLSRKVKNSAK